MSWGREESSVLRFQLRRRERPAWEGDAGRDEEDMIAGDVARDGGTFQALLSLMRQLCRPRCVSRRRQVGISKFEAVTE